MLFNSTVFLGFLIVVLAANFTLRRRRSLQNRMLLVASYVFYGWWDWRFLGLIALSTVVDFTVARAIAGSSDDRRRRLLLCTSVATNLGILATFKYSNFFVDQLAEILAPIGLSPSDLELNIVLPVGISFYTFQTMSYTIDVYRRHLEPTTNLADFALYVAFFPQLVAGPIERGTRLMPQISRARTVTAHDIEQGIGLIVLGYFKKVFVADNVGPIADSVFASPGDASGIGVLVGILAFAIQIYGDFSGYSDIARGVAKLLGFDLMVNFRVPYAALSPSDFWQRWHISLSTWLRDYLYIPLGGNRAGSSSTYRNLMITMVLGGLWHGASWTFVLWGVFHGSILCIYRYANERRGVAPTRTGAALVAITAVRWSAMITLTMIGWVIFRATSIDNLVDVLANIGPSFSADAKANAADLLFFAAPLVLFEVIVQSTRDLSIAERMPPAARGTLYGAVAFFTVVFAAGGSAEFIYFTF